MILLIDGKVTRQTSFEKIEQRAPVGKEVFMIMLYEGKKIFKEQIRKGRHSGLPYELRTIRGLSEKDLMENENKYPEADGRGFYVGGEG